MTDLTKLSVRELETMMDNARTRSGLPGAQDAYRAAAIELFKRHGAHRDDPVLAGCWGAIGLADRARYERTGKRLKSNHSLASIKRNGELAFMTACALGRTLGTGFDLLVEAGLGMCTVEYVVAANATAFPDDAVQSARARLAARGIALP
ncbi:hypothetical protein [Bradyrhizobium sp. USDA 329]|uniref:hypothetical protein n=1 Tax=unclassified Bradyrhizobium TaxID=2631580 RepID=UPI003518C262